MSRSNRSWYSLIQAAGAAPVIRIDDVIGDFGITAKDFEQEVRALGKPPQLDLHINSPGGEVFAGNAIYNVLNRMKASGTHITVYIDGLAASMASLVAMVGDEVIMPANAFMMIHNPAGVVLGTSKDMRDLANLLDRLKQGMVNAYATKSGKDPDAVSELMDAETWFTAAEAVEQGFADTIEEEMDIAAVFDLGKYVNAPDVAGAARGPAASSTMEHNMPPNQSAETPEQMEARITAEVTARLAAEAKAKETVAPVAAATAAQGETPEQMEARIRSDIEGRIAEIEALCDLADLPEMKGELRGKTVAEARAALTAKKTANAQADKGRRSGVTLPSNRTPTGQQTSEGVKSADPDLVREIDTHKIWSKWNGRRSAA